jgi:uncharacterized protein
MAWVVEHHTQAQRFEVALPGTAQVAACVYRQQGTLLVLHHTEVPPALQGQGIAAVLVQAALAWARSQHFKVRPTCSYVAAYMRRHPETLDLLEHPEAP